MRRREKIAEVDAALRRVATAGRDGDVDALIIELGTPGTKHAALRTLAAIELARMAEGGRTEAAEKAVPQLVLRIEDPSPDVRAAAARALGRLRAAEAVHEIVKLLCDEVSFVRHWAARSLGWIGDRRAVPELAGFVTSDDPIMRRFCAEALAKIGDAGGVVAIRAAIALEPTWRKRRRLVKYLRKLERSANRFDDQDG